MSPVTRIVAFKYKTAVTEGQKRKLRDDFMKVYEDRAHMVNRSPAGGKNNNPEGFDKGFSVLFIVEFRSEELRDEFSSAQAHVTFQMSAQGLVDDLFVYDFTEGEYGY